MIDGAIQDKVFDGDLTPSSIIPTLEIIKNTERALSGKLHVDITDSKQKLQVIFDMLEDENFKIVQQVFNVDDMENIAPEGIEVEYFDIRKNVNATNTRRFFVDKFSFTPFILNDKIIWQNVAVDLLEM